MLTMTATLLALTTLLACLDSSTAHSKPRKYLEVYFDAIKYILDDVIDH